MIKIRQSVRFPSGVSVFVTIHILLVLNISIGFAADERRLTTYQDEWNTIKADDAVYKSDYKLYSSTQLYMKGKPLDFSSDENVYTFKSKDQDISDLKVFQDGELKEVTIPWSSITKVTGAYIVLKGELIPVQHFDVLGPYTLGHVQLEKDGAVLRISGNVVPRASGVQLRVSGVLCRLLPLPLMAKKIEVKVVSDNQDYTIWYEGGHDGIRNEEIFDVVGIRSPTSDVGWVKLFDGKEHWWYKEGEEVEVKGGLIINVGFKPSIRDRDRHVMVYVYKDVKEITSEQNKLSTVRNPILFGTRAWRVRIHEEEVEVTINIVLTNNQVIIIAIEAIPGSFVFIRNELLKMDGISYVVSKRHTKGTYTHKEQDHTFQLEIGGSLPNFGNYWFYLEDGAKKEKIHIFKTIWIDHLSALEGPCMKLRMPKHNYYLKDIPLREQQSRDRYIIRQRIGRMVLHRNGLLKDLGTVLENYFYHDGVKSGYVERKKQNQWLTAVASDNTAIRDLASNEFDLCHVHEGSSKTMCLVKWSCCTTNFKCSTYFEYYSKAYGMINGVYYMDPKNEMSFAMPLSIEEAEAFFGEEKFNKHKQVMNERNKSIEKEIEEQNTKLKELQETIVKDEKYLAKHEMAMSEVRKYYISGLQREMQEARQKWTDIIVGLQNLYKKGSVDEGPFRDFHEEFQQLEEKDKTKHADLFSTYETAKKLWEKSNAATRYYKHHLHKVVKLGSSYFLTETSGLLAKSETKEPPILLRLRDNLLELKFAVTLLRDLENEIIKKVVKKKGEN